MTQKPLYPTRSSATPWGRAQQEERTRRKKEEKELNDRLSKVSEPTS